MILDINLGAYLLLFCLLFGQMAVLLWACGAIVGATASPKRLAAGAALGAFYDILVDLASFGVLPGQILTAWYTVLAVALMTFAMAYWQLPPGRRWWALGAYWFLAVLAAGVAYAVRNLGAAGWAPPLVATAVILAVAELGWGVVQSWVWERVVYLPVEIELLGRKAKVTALLDTGNQLTDPVSGYPVLILAGELRTQLLSPEAAEAVGLGEPAEGIARLAGTEYAARVRLIPFSAVGQGNGLLLSLRADTVRFAAGETTEETGTALVAFHQGPLDPGGTYQALVHPAQLRKVLAQVSRRRGYLALRPGLPGEMPAPGKGE